MAGKKLLGSTGLRRLRNSYLKNEGNFTHTTLDEALDRDEVIKAASEYGTYKMKELYPDTYATMTSVPEGLDVSKLRIADGLFQGCAALTSIDGLDLSNAISAEHIFEDCKALKSVKGIVAPKCASWAYAFQGCTSLADIEAIDTSRVSNLHGMFLECAARPDTFPWTLELSNAWDKLAGGTGAIFGFSSVRNVTLKQDWRLNLHALILTSYDSYTKKYEANFDRLIGEYFQEYRQHHDVDTTAASVTMPFPIGNDTYNVTIPEPADWAKESYYDAYRKNMELFFSLNLTCNSQALYSVKETTTNFGTLKTIKTYDEDPSNYQDVITYETAINRTDYAITQTWADKTTSEIPAKTIMFKKNIEHILKNAIHITWA